MTDEQFKILSTQIHTLTQGISATLDSQNSILERLDLQERSLRAIAIAIGFTYLATGSDQPLPVEVLEDPAFEQFIALYPIDGPPIVGTARMDELMAQLDKEPPERLAAGFRELEKQVTLSQHERIRNQQIERRARERHGDLEAIKRGAKDR